MKKNVHGGVLVTLIGTAIFWAAFSPIILSHDIQYSNFFGIHLNDDSQPLLLLARVVKWHVNCILVKLGLLVENDQISSAINIIFTGDSIMKTAFLSGIAAFLFIVASHPLHAAESEMYNNTHYSIVVIMTTGGGMLGPSETKITCTDFKDNKNYHKWYTLPFVRTVKVNRIRKQAFDTPVHCSDKSAPIIERQIGEKRFYGHNGGIKLTITQNPWNVVFEKK